MITPFECYSLYIALKQHFTNPTYDFFLYEGKTNVSVESFQKRTDFYSFKKLANKRFPGTFIVANVVAQPPTKPFPYIGDLVSDKKSEQNYTEWEKRKQSLSRFLKEDLKQLDIDFDNNIKTDGNKLPPLLKLQLTKKISPELPVIICKMIPGVLPYWESKKGKNPILDSYIMRTKKYLPFVEYDESRIKQVIFDHFQPPNT